VTARLVTVVSGMATGPDLVGLHASVPGTDVLQRVQAGAGADLCVELARRHGLPLGLGECGGTNGARRASDQLFARFMNYLTGVFAARLDKGLDNAACMYFCGGPANVPTVAQYDALRRFYNSVAASPGS